MSKKILTVLAPVAALIAFMVVPAIAQATSLQAPAGIPLGVGGAVKGQSVNLVTDQANGHHLECAHSEFNGTVASTGGEDVTGNITSSAFSHPCATNVSNVTADITTNTSSTAPWKLQLQQPEASGQVTGHILPNAAGGFVKFTAQLQLFESFDVGTCNFRASSVQLMGSTASHIASVEGTNQFELEAGSGSECGTAGEKATLQGEIQFSSGTNKVFVDMT
jgi:hypothetical protein